MKRSEKDIFSSQSVDPFVLEEKKRKTEEFWATRKGEAVKRKMRYLRQCERRRRLLSLEENKKEEPQKTYSVWDNIGNYQTTKKNKTPQRIRFISIPMGGQKRK